MTALNGKQFVFQLLGRASISRLQLGVRNACRKYGQADFRRRCPALALANAYLEENGKKQPGQASSAAPVSPQTMRQSYITSKLSYAVSPNDETVFHYCSIQISGIRRSYFYLTDDLSLQVGDWVEIPFGKDNMLRQGRVQAVMDCIRAAAPWPPEQTKTVIRVIDTPVIEPVMEAATPKIKKRIDPPAKQSEKEEKSVIPMQKAEIKQPKVETPIAEPAVSENKEKKPVPPKKPFPFKKFIAAVLAATVLAGISIAVAHQNKQKAAAYAAALQKLSSGDYTSAEQDFSDLAGYRDSVSLSVYCTYADIYKDRTDYAGGQDELSNIKLQYDTGWQQDIDALLSRVKIYQAEKDAEEAENAAKQEQNLKAKYSGKLPVEGMPMSCLKYTCLGPPDKEQKCLNYDHLIEAQRSISIWWYRSDGTVRASGTCFKRSGDSEFMLYSFSHYELSDSSNKGQTFHSGGGSKHSSSIRDDYDNPEDLWEDNRDWYEDEDEAWDEWYDD